MTLRLTWVQPEDLVGHELRQAAQDGRDAREIERRWYAAGGAPTVWVDYKAQKSRPLPDWLRSQVDPGSGPG